MATQSECGRSSQVQEGVVGGPGEKGAVQADGQMDKADSIGIILQTAWTWEGAGAGSSQAG